ncbi:putative isochorismate synthase [Helianthus annuus]|nr:putative isochorismate synthase [Helianthus annuus]KAJ0658077.1 putative isochorismate synthase [Helianthus annuus]
MVESENAYQFCLQPPDAPSFIGNTPEQLFHRNRFDIYSEAMAGTRARGDSKALDLQIALDLLYSSKDDKEFSIVRECIKRNLEAVCTTILVEPEKTIRKLSRVQHLYARIRGRLRSEDDEVCFILGLANGLGQVITGHGSEGANLTHSLPSGLETNKVYIVIHSLRRCSFIIM